VTAWGFFGARDTCVSLAVISEPWDTWRLRVSRHIAWFLICYARMILSSRSSVKYVGEV
jgi:hypothetical protein